MTAEPKPSSETPEAQGFPEPETRPAHWFKAGDPRTIEAARKGGRPRKGESAPELLLREVNRRAPKIIDGLLSKAEKGDTRAFVAAFDRAFGVPKQSLVIERPDDPMLLWLQRMTGGDLPAEDLPALPPPDANDSSP